MISIPLCLDSRGRRQHVFFFSSVCPSVPFERLIPMFNLVVPCGHRICAGVSRAQATNETIFPLVVIGLFSTRKLYFEQSNLRCNHKGKPSLMLSSSLKLNVCFPADNVKAYKHVRAGESCFLSCSSSRHR